MIKQFELKRKLKQDIYLNIRLFGYRVVNWPYSTLMKTGNYCATAYVTAYNTSTEISGAEMTVPRNMAVSASPNVRCALVPHRPEHKEGEITVYNHRRSAAEVAGTALPTSVFRAHVSFRSPQASARPP